MMRLAAGTTYWNIQYVVASRTLPQMEGCAWPSSRVMQKANAVIDPNSVRGGLRRVYERLKHRRQLLISCVQAGSAYSATFFAGSAQA